MRISDWSFRRVLFRSGVLNSKGRLNRITENGVVWENGQKEGFDTIVWCTGFRYATAHLQPLGIVDEKFRVATDGTRAKALDGLWLVGYGNWTGFASATLIGVGRSARQTVSEVSEYVQNAGRDRKSKRLNYSH